MFIQTEPTPNPATLKFLPGRDVAGSRLTEYRSAAEAQGSPLAVALFSVEGVSQVFLGGDFVSVEVVAGGVTGSSSFRGTWGRSRNSR